jgi:Cu2+-exporting ATPase
LLLTAVSLGYCGQEFFSRAWASLRFSPITRWSIDVPIALALLIGFAYSVRATFVGEGAIWFDSLAVLVAALLTTRWMEVRGQRAAREATARLVSLLPSHATRVSDEGEASVPVEDLVPGDTIVVRLGDAIPADGVVLAGQGSIVRAVMTGESAPVPVQSGDAVHAGETNAGPVLRVRVERAGRDTRLGELLAWIQSADPRPEERGWIDKIAGGFVLAVVVMAVATWVFWTLRGSDMAVAHMVALLVVACPCAIGMAAPLGGAVATGRAAARGIFVKSTAALAALADVDYVVFDKTGTLTSGRPRLRPSADAAPDTMALVAALQRHSTHPLAAGFAEFDQEYAATDVVEHPGLGIEGVVTGSRVRVGSPAWFDQPDGASFFVEVDGARFAVDAVDPLRDDARASVDAVRAAGAEPVLLSGDTAAVVADVADALDIGSGCWFARETPERKLARIQAWQESGARVAMVGDGVNDAAALEAADVGIAVHRSADVTISAADVWTTREGLEPLVELRGIAHSMNAIVRRNLIVSLCYNIIAVSAAAAGLVTPLVAAVAMPLSSLYVVASSLRIRHDRALSPGSSRRADGGRLRRGVLLGSSQRRFRRHGLSSRPRPG